ncbi:MAG TPA: SURF1 family protein [Burkholderiales bacterium]|nr:SURF1 family protein [Burkholderiales bacterium]
MPRGYSFHFRPWVAVAAALGCAAGIALGNWQSGRAAEKRALGEVERVSLNGEFVARFTVFLDNKVHQRQAGYEVVTPLKLARTGEHVLVRRGWVAAPRTRDVLPEVRTPRGEVRIEGVVQDRFPRLLAQGAGGGKVRQTLDIEDFARETGLALQRRVIEQHSDTGDGLVREWPRPDLGVEKHQSYALQWYSLAALAVALGLVSSFRKR